MSCLRCICLLLFAAQLQGLQQCLPLQLGLAKLSQTVRQLRCYLALKPQVAWATLQRQLLQVI